MKFQPSLAQGTLLRRYKRFLADIRCSDGREITIHCPNTGSMKHCLAENSPCWYSRSDNPKRKYAHTWEIATTPSGDLAGINTSCSNALVVEAIKSGCVTELQGYENLATEVRYGDERSRIDILLSTGSEVCYVEVKNVTMAVGDGLGLFPDSVSARGTKHLRELMLMREKGHRAVLFYCVQHTGIQRVSPASDIDPVYANTLAKAIDAGVEVLAYGAKMSPNEIVLQRALPFNL